MLSPATPLTILLLVSFILLLLSVLSTPIIHGIPIATFEGVNFGVFGYCKGSDCSKIRIGYTTDGLFNEGNTNNDFNLSSSARHSLSSLLIVHPVAAFFNLVCLALAAAAHLPSPSHSARYLLGLLILLLPTLLVTLLAFLVDILLFVPHLQWGGWIVLVSTILITVSGVVTCAMRRTMVARIARKKRIADNAEMSGENYYNRQNQELKLMSATPLLTQAGTPMVNGSIGADKLPTFPQFESSHARIDEDREPLTPQIPSNSATAAESQGGPGEAYYGQQRSKSQGPFNRPVDEFGRPLPPSNAFGPAPAGMRRNQSEERGGVAHYRDNAFRPPSRGLGSRGRGGFPRRGDYGGRQYSGRGGFSGTRGPPPPSGRGGYPGDGRGRGGMPVGPMAAGAGAAAGAMMYRGPRAPPPGYVAQGGGVGSGPYSRPGDMREGPRSPINASHGMQGEEAYRQNAPQDYARLPNEYVAYGARAQSPARDDARRSPYGSTVQSPVEGVRQPSPPPPVPVVHARDAPIGHAVEMGTAAEFMPAHDQFRDGDADVEGIMGPPQNRQGGPTELESPVERYGQDKYVPARAAWAPPRHATTTLNAPDNLQSPHQNPQSPPVELSTSLSHVAGPTYDHTSPRLHSSRPNRLSSGGSDVYYEDVEPRFATETDPLPPAVASPMPTHETLAPPMRHPNLLVPGFSQRHPPPGPRQMPPPMGATASYEDLQQGARSPAESDTSNFTSVSQRGVNPNWRPGMPGGDVGSYGPGGAIQRKAIANQQAQMKQDVLLAGNPDFEIPGMAPGRIARGGGMGGRGRGGYGGAGGVGRSAMGGSPVAATNVGIDGKYPAPSI